MEFINNINAIVHTCLVVLWASLLTIFFWLPGIVYADISVTSVTILPAYCNPLAKNYVPDRPECNGESPVQQYTCDAELGNCNEDISSGYSGGRALLFQSKEVTIDSKYDSVDGQKKTQDSLNRKQNRAIGIPDDVLALPDTYFVDESGKVFGYDGYYFGNIKENDSKNINTNDRFAEKQKEFESKAQSGRPVFEDSAFDDGEFVSIRKSDGALIPTESESSSNVNNKASSVNVASPVKESGSSPAKSTDPSSGSGANAREKHTPITRVQSAVTKSFNSVKVASRTAVSTSIKAVNKILQFISSSDKSSPSIVNKDVPVLAEIQQRVQVFAQPKVLLSIGNPFSIVVQSVNFIQKLFKW